VSDGGWQQRARTAVSNLLVVLAFPAVLVGSVVAGIGWICWIVISLLGIPAMRWNGHGDMGHEILTVAAWLGASTGILVVGRLMVRLLPVASHRSSGALAFAITTGVGFLGLSLYVAG
jgi:hypothetical protein